MVNGSNGGLGSSGRAGRRVTGFLSGSGRTETGGSVFDGIVKTALLYFADKQVIRHELSE